MINESVEAGGLSDISDNLGGWVTFLDVGVTGGGLFGTGVIIGYGITKLIELGITIGTGGVAAPILAF